MILYHSCGFSKMSFFLIAILAMIYAGTSQAGTLEVIDYDGHCLIWSNDNFGCTGYSASFGLLGGAACSGKPLPLKPKTAINKFKELSEVVKGNRPELNMLNVDVCGSEDGSPVAWIQVNHTGRVTFTNKNGNQASCVLNEGLKTGSWCVTIEKKNKINSPSYSSTGTPSTGTPSTSTPSTGTSSTSTSSTSTPSTGTSRQTSTTRKRAQVKLASRCG
ncbi:unnamed protein product [Penicillium salamii]|uniref:Secreted protein n=1 Tax=Penicillium salamii TaxID=1612424 RepID=A0A9W4N4Y3_9EURO|nr:unnamed protein product [Penicillium salamii]CAG8236867.1 unnamed protein product [Penicillium salamii]CAG8255215.1 unnamed protein product [Penicillium salamii]CAG8314147.1 unnamed protein product [Penicillium salamii]CAG8340784.1 unnamed protein product [Penicillium salamii]